MRGALVLLLLLALPLAALPASAQATGPQPPCDAAPVPPYGVTGGPAAVGAWSGSALARLGWQPAACLGWQGGSRMVAALASRFHSAASLDQLAARLTAVSQQPAIRFWAVTRQLWRPLVTDAWALDGPDGTVRRPDPTAASLVPGSDLYYAAQPETGNRTIYRVHVLAHTADMLVLATENISAIRVAILTLFQPRALQVVTFLHNSGPDSWELYQITRATEASSFLATRYEAAYLNRLDAMHRYLADIPTDREPPIAPR